VIVWGMTPVKAVLNGSPILAPRWNVPELHRLVFRDFPVVPQKIDPAQITNPDYQNAHAEPAVYTFNWVSATGTGVLLATLATALYFRVSLARLLAVAATTMRRMRVPLATIMLMLSLGFVTRYGGTDATLGLAFTKTGKLYPFFATFLGWLGVALTGSDTSSNVLFGSLQKITAQQLGFNPVLIVTANSTGGVMGKMIDAQSIVVSTASTGQVGQEGRILRFVFWHSVALATIMAIIVTLQAYVFQWMIP
jgi:lactate permease